MSDDWWTDARQDRRIRQLQGEVEAAYTYAADRSRALQSKLSQVQGTLERRLDRLARSFDAFVELSDLRMELAVFDREAAVRHRTRRLLMGLARHAGDPPPLGLDDCPGYWLKPAADTLAALVRGDSAEKSTAEALERDEDRTTLFLTLGLAVAGRYSEAVPWLSRALPVLGATVTTVQRRLWIACADGAFGEPGRAHVERRLTEFVEELPPEAADAQRARWARTAADGGNPRANLPRELQNETALTEPPIAAERLDRLRTRLEEALSPADSPPAADFTTILNTLVDEGGPEERPLVTRARELRQIIEQGGPDQAPAWDAPAGETLALLHADMFERGEPGPRALAARVGRSWLLTVAADLAEKAAVRPPATVRVRVHGHDLQVGTDGSPDLPEAQARIDGAAATGPAGERLGLAVAVVGVVVTVLTIAAGLAGLAVLAVLMVVVGGGIWLKQRSVRTRARDTAEQDKDRLARQVQAVAGALNQCHSGHRRLTGTATADREAIVALLT